MQHLTEQIKKALATLAYADAGEMLSTTQKDRVLGTPGRAQPTMAAHQALSSAPTPPALITAIPPLGSQIGLYLGASLEEPVMRYAIDACKRTHAILTVVTFQSEEEARVLLQPYHSELGREGVVWQTVRLSKDPRRSLTRYLKGASRMQFLVCSEVGFLGHALLSNSRRPDLGLPIVVVAGKRQVAKLPRETVAWAQQ
ncbi:MAG: hypothetical protein ACFCVA_13300 [Gammaproteobacteria bacterium]